MTNLILLIGDNKSANRTLRLILNRTAPELRVEIRAGRAGIEEIHTPTVILLDLMLKNEPAFQVLRWLRAEPRYKNVPVFALAPRAGDFDDAYALGADSCLLHDSVSEEFERIAHGIGAYASLKAASSGMCFA